MKSWIEWLIGIIAIAGAVGLLIALMLYNPADIPTQQEHMIVTPAVTAPPQVKASVVTPEVKPVEMPPEPQTATENDSTVEEEEIYAEEETVTESEYGSQDEPEELPDEPLVPEVSEEAETPVEDRTYLGTWTITAYCDCPICTGQWSGSPTASGAWPSEGWTIACGSLPFGTMVYIEGVGTRCVEDRGVDGDWIDVFFSNHDTADSFGMQYLEVYLIE